MDLPHGVQRHRIMWVREMDKVEARKVGQTGPTIDHIDVAEFEGQEEMREWLGKVAPGILRGIDQRFARACPVIIDGS